ncbi:MAG: hypothetical protein R3C05_26790 [Pirellulaceae bacterium]
MAASPYLREPTTLAAGLVLADTNWHTISAYSLVSLAISSSIPKRIIIAEVARRVVLAGE